MYEVKQFWKAIRHLSYSSAVWNYEDNNFIEIAKKFGLKIECCNTIYDLLDSNYCVKCGKKLRSKQ